MASYVKEEDVSAGAIGSIGSNNVATVDAVDKFTDFITRSILHHQVNLITIFK